MAFVNKGLYTITSDSGAKFSFTLFEGVTTDNGSVLGGNSIQCSLVAYSSGYDMTEMNTMTFNNGAVTLRKRDGWYLDAQLVDSGGTLNWGGNLSADNNYDRCCPLAVFHYKDDDSWGLSGASFQYGRKTSESLPDTRKWKGVGISRPDNGKAGYFAATAENSVTSDNTGFITKKTHPQIVELLSGAKSFITDPYEQGGGESGTGGGGGSFDNTSTPIDIPNLPSISAASTGFISLFNPTLDQLNELSSYLWSDLFEINGWKKLFADPMDAILGLSIVPVAVPSGGTREVKVGNIGTGISLTIASSQFVEVDCGSIDVNEYWGAYLDYEPYTQAQIFLPYIGTRPISVDEIMGKIVRVVYHVDILTGACCCFVKCGDSVLYTYNGQCSIPIPITGANYASVVNGVISVAASVGSLVATGGSSAPTAIPAIASSAVNQMKPQVEKSGSISGSAGVLNMQTPYLILIRPRQALPSKQNEFIGYPSLITVQLTELKGYTEVQSIHLENIPATQEELAEIESLLKGGAIF